MRPLAIAVATTVATLAPAVAACGAADDRRTPARTTAAATLAADRDRDDAPGHAHEHAHAREHAPGHDHPHEHAPGHGHAHEREHEHAAAQPRVVVADGAAPTVRVLDARRGRTLGTFRVGGPAALTTTDGGRYVIATQSARDRVDALDVGAFSEPHGDHVHYHTLAPRLLPFRLTVPKPVHVVPHGDEVAIFADGSGEGRVFTLAALRRRAARPRAALPSGTPHHGVAVPLGDRFVLSRADPAAADGALPRTLDVVDRGGRVLASATCPELHGEASHGAWAAFGCEDGIALVKPGAGAAAPTSETLAYPAGASAERRAFALHTDAAGRRLVGGFGDRAFVVVNVASKRSRVVEAGATVAGFGVDGRSGAILALTTDGLLRRFDAASGRQTATRRVVARRFAPAWDRPAPKLTVRGGLAAVSDPARGRVTVVRTGGLRLVRALEVAGAPTQVALAGTAG